MNLKGQHILSTKQFDKKSLLGLFAEAKKMEKVVDSAKKGKQSKILEGKIMATLFYEPSTRTRFSFEAAMLRLGGRVLSNADMLMTSSAKKSETLFDTGKVVSQMADVIAMRHSQAEALHELAAGSDVPVINCGNGPEDHPTQALLDAYTIWKELGKIDGLTIGVIGDLKHSRVLHSQVLLFRQFKGVKFVFISPKELALPLDLKEGIDYVESDDLAKVIGELDVISVNRIQEERFASQKEADKYRGCFIVQVEFLKKAKRDALILCPLPRREELPVEVDKDFRAKYFEQVGNGVAVRMALLKEVLGA
ncbi:MAG: aspartate carbamoyltransferase [Patescibacteria group bacterium]